MDFEESRCAASYRTLQMMIGWAGLLMPVAVRGGGLLFEGIRTTDSLSAYYYTSMRDIFVATTVLTGVLLACYRTPHRIDNIAATIAGLAGIGLALFPMDPTYAAELLARYPDLGSERHYSNHGVLGYHLFFAVTFAALSFYLVYFRFGAHTPASSPEHRLRKRLYRACGATMLLSFAAIAVLAATVQGASLFWPETSAVVAFAVAWLIKGSRSLGGAWRVPAPRMRLGRD